jgi:predicted dithiol-disulfide oxidoreductase (DUF899 family)
VISRAPIDRIEQVKRALGWTFPWVSSYRSDFNFDFGVSFKRGDLAAGRANFNYNTIPLKGSEDMMGASIFAKNESGEIFHTYSTYSWNRKSDGRFHVARPYAQGPTSIR